MDLEHIPGAMGVRHIFARREETGEPGGNPGGNRKIVKSYYRNHHMKNSI